MAARPKRTYVEAASVDAEGLIERTLLELKSAVNANKDKFFPNGIELISFEVKVSNIGVTFKVAGPKAVSALLEAQLEPAPKV